MKIQILTTPGCSGCKTVEKYLDELGLHYDVIDVTENPEFLQKYPIFTAPGIVIDGKLEFAGTPSKKKLLNMLKPE
jgi:glutaredoxin